MVDEENGHSDFPQLSDLIHGLPDGASSIQPGYESKLQYNEDKDNEDCSLFVGDIPKTMTEEQMAELFSPFGEVVLVDIKRDRVTKASLGYAFIQFQTRDEAANAKKKLHKTVVANRAIRIGWAQKNTNLFVGDLDPSVTNEMLRERFRVFGEIIDDETFAKKQNYGFVKFRRRVDAEVAKREMDGKVIGGRRIRTGWGDTNTQRHCVHIQFDPSLSSSLTSSLSPTLSSILTEEDLFKSFSPFGTVLNVHLPRTGTRLRGFGFVRYSDTDEGEESAEAAIAALHNTRIGGASIACNFGKKQHPRKPSSLPPISSSHHDNIVSSSSSSSDDSFPKSPKLQMAHENTFSSNNNDRDYEKGHDKILDSSIQFPNPFGRARSTYHNNKSSPQMSRNNNNNNKMPLSHNNNINNNISQMEVPMPPHSLPLSSHSHSHSLSSHSQYPQMIPTMYPTSWVPTQDGWVPYVVPQYYPPVSMHSEENNTTPVNNLFHHPGRMQPDDVSSVSPVSPVYMYSYPFINQNFSYSYSSHAS